MQSILKHKHLRHFTVPIKLCVVTLLVCIQLTSAFSQHRLIRLKQLVTKDGLSNFTVLSMTQDDNGFMWFGTRDGLNRYDGKAVKIYRNNSDKDKALGNGYIWSLLCTSDSGMWVGTNEGLYHYNLKYDDFTRVVSGDNHSPVRALFNDDGILWVGTEEGLLRYDLQGGDFSVNNNDAIAASFTNHKVLSFFKSQNGTLWIGSDKGLYSVINGQVEHVQIHPNEQLDKSIEINCIIQSEDRKIWVASENRDVGLIVYDPNTKSSLEISEEKGSLLNNTVRTLFQKGKDEIWVGTRDGMMIFDPGQYEYQELVQHKTDPGSLSQNSIRDIFQSREGIMWIGTYSGGAKYFDPESQKIEHHTDGFKNETLENYNITTAIYKDSQQKLWVGTEGRGVYVLNKAGQKVAEYKSGPEGLAHDKVKDITEDEQGRIFIATNNGLSILNLGSDKFINISYAPTPRGYLQSGTIHDLTKDAQGNIWIGTIGGDCIFQVYDMARDSIVRFYPPKVDFPNTTGLIVNTQTYDPERNMIWAGGDNGLAGFDLNSKTYLTHENFRAASTSLYGVIVYDLLVKDGFLWIATVGRGIYLLNLDTYFLENLRDKKLDENSFYALVEDKQGGVWASSDDQLVKISKTGNGVYKIQKYSEHEGYPPQQYYRKAVQVTNDGKVYFGGHNGFVSFYPNEISDRVMHPQVVVNEIVVNGQKLEISVPNTDRSLNVSTLSVVELDYSQSSFAVNIVAPNFNNPDNVWYQYQLSSNKMWQDLGNSQAINFSELKPGSYELKLRASTDKTIFSDEYTSIQIEISPPFWATPLAYLGYMLIVLGLLYLFYYITRKWERLAQKLKYEHLEREKEHDFNQKRVKFFTDISHELRTPLTLILAPLEKIVTTNFGNARVKNQLMLMLRNGERMLQLINQLLDLRKLETGNVKLQVAKGNIVHFVKEVSLSFRELAKSRDVQFEVLSAEDEILIWFDRDKFEIILYNLLSNAVKYTPDGGSIEVRLTGIKEDGQITLKVMNTGRGISEQELEHVFERFYSSRSGQDAASYSSGVGLEIVKKLVEMHHGTVSVSSQFDERGVKGNATFEVSVPGSKAHFSKDEIISGFIGSEDIKSYKRLQSDVEAEIEEPKPLAPETPKEETILIVEDNAEVQRLVADVFRDDFNILLADDGNKGCQLASEEIPDLIISDIMMPGIDGIELCRRVKSEINTSHIPVVLLTARTAVTFKYEGLETGADDYIVKPFAVGDLKLRVTNIIKQRKLLKQKFTNSAFVPAEITLTSVDEKLMQRTVDYITEHLEDSELTVEKISTEVGMSRVHFYRKIKALTNMSAAEFLRKIRMEHAERLLKTNKFNVSEVRYRVGFTDADYFRKCFKEEFGVTPKEFIDSSKNQIN